MSRWANGFGPGGITQDGCAVQLYARLSPAAEPEIIHSAIPAEATVLELGAGAGRVTHALLDLGHPVVAVDESAEMLEHIHDARTVHSRIEDLDLGERFDAVVLGSYLVNTPDDAQRRALLSACRRHVSAGGRVLIERRRADAYDAMAPGRAEHDGVTYIMRDVEHPAPGTVALTMEYRLGDQCWVHAFVARGFDVAELEPAGLAFTAELTDDGSWIAAAAV